MAKTGMLRPSKTKLMQGGAGDEREEKQMQVRGVTQ